MDPAAGSEGTIFRSTLECSLFVHICVPMLARGAIVATPRGSLIDSPKPELGEGHYRLRDKDEEQGLGVFRA
jgi:hypothetical protein